MGQVSKHLRRCTTKAGGIGYGHYCPGCEEVHIIWTAAPSGPVWAFNQNVDKPTFSPSIRIFEPAHVYEGVKVPEKTLCHYFITDGNIVFCGDCDHELKGKTMSLPVLPDCYDDSQYGWPGQ